MFNQCEVHGTHDSFTCEDTPGGTTFAEGDSIHK